MNATDAQVDRAVGVLIGCAAGDALGAPHEFRPPLPATFPLTMTGGGSFDWEPGEWTDDTSMAVVIARTAARTRDLLAPSAQDEIVSGWVEWMRGASDIGLQTQAVLTRIVLDPTAASAVKAARAVHESSGRSAGNGSLMRTGPVALAYLDDPAGLTLAARSISTLTHWEDDAGDACVLWCHAIRHAVLTGELPELGAFVSHLPQERQDLWLTRIAEARESEPREFANNGWVVAALQAAWSAVVRDAQGTPRTRIERAVRCGHDTDTVAAIAGSLAGAIDGADAIPSEWREILHGYPGADSRTLQALAEAIVTR